MITNCIQYFVNICNTYKVLIFLLFLPSIHNNHTCFYGIHKLYNHSNYGITGCKHKFHWLFMMAQKTVETARSEFTSEFI